MILVKRTAFTIIYLVITFYLLFETTIPTGVVLSFVIIFSAFISRNGLLAGLESFFKNARENNTRLF